MKLLTIPQFAEQLQISKSTVWNWLREGRIKGINIGPKLIRIEQSELNKIMNKKNAKRTKTNSINRRSRS